MSFELEGLDGFEEGSLICNHLQDACDMCRGVYCPCRGWKEANTPQIEEGENKVPCSSEDQSLYLECVSWRAIGMPLKDGEHLMNNNVRES